MTRPFVLTQDIPDDSDAGRNTVGTEELELSDTFLTKINNLDGELDYYLV